MRAFHGVVSTAHGGNAVPRELAVRAAAAACLAIGFSIGAVPTGGLTGTGLQPALADSDGKRDLPRFASLKASEVNLRKGPGTQYPTAWVFRNAGLPVEIVREYEAWREVRDAEGTTGWVLKSLLSARRTALVVGGGAADRGGSDDRRFTLRRGSSLNSGVVAVLAPGVIADIYACDGRWCRVTVGAYRGYFAQTQLWGVYPGEKF